MIRVTIDLISAITGRTSTLGTMYIANDGSGTADRGDYKVAVCKRGGSTEVPRELFAGGHLDPDDAAQFAADHPKAMRAAEVKDYPRLAYNVWRLIARSVLAAFPEEARRAKRDERTLLDADVMRGLRLLSNTNTPSNDPAIVAARAWLDAANADPAE